MAAFTSNVTIKLANVICAAYEKWTWFFWITKNVSGQVSSVRSKLNP
jgi:hypothetical protein